MNFDLQHYLIKYKIEVLLRHGLYFTLCAMEKLIIIDYPKHRLL